MFLVFGLPRSRLRWMSMYLTYGDHTCWHDQAMHMRSLDDLKAAFSMPNTGYAEMGAAPAWPVLRSIRPDAKVVVIRRDPGQVERELLAMDLGGVAALDPRKLTSQLRRLDRDLGRIEQRWPGAISVKFDDLNNQDERERVFYHCLPYAFDQGWDNVMAGLHVETEWRPMLRYRFAHRAGIAHFKSLVSREMRRLARGGLA